MSQTRYCSTCGALLGDGAAICGECGARYQASPYERRATDAPGAWSQAPAPRSRDLGAASGAEPEEEGIELITRDSLEPANPDATTLRATEQYDQMMVTQPPMPQSAPGGPSGFAAGSGSSALPPDSSQPTSPSFAPPLDGCAPSTPLKRLVAAILDGLISAVIAVPFGIGLGLALSAESASTLSLVLIGVGVALPAAYAVLILWLTGSKGFSLGKLIMGLRVTRMSQAGPIGFLRALGRSAVFGAAGIVPVIGPLVMPLSIFLDPKKLLRGFHDRAVDSVVVDIKAGRDPMRPRPDDFERESADHYLGAPSVAVTAHENLMAEPGAAWQVPAGSGAEQSAAAAGWGSSTQGSPYAPSGASAASATDAPGGAWGAPSAGSASQGGDGGWAPPVVDPVPDAPAWGQHPSAQPWDQPAPSPQGAPQPGSSQSAGQSWDQPSWDQPAAPATEAAQQPPAQPSWPAGHGSSAPGAEAPQPWEPSSAQPSSAQPSWDQPAPSESSAPAPSWGQEPPAPQVEAAAGWGAPSGAPQAPSAPAAEEAPSELTADAWTAEDHGVDEQTRLTLAEDPLGDLEQTRISAVQLPPVTSLRLTLDDGTERVVQKAVVVGRNPSAPAGEVLFVMKDDTRSVSKTHLRIDGTGDEVVLTDLGSTNGSAIVRPDGSRESLVPNTPTILPAGAQVTLGDRTLSVERTQ